MSACCSWTTRSSVRFVKMDGLDVETVLAVVSIESRLPRDALVATGADGTMSRNIRAVSDAEEPITIAERVNSIRSVRVVVDLE
jgi:hypothetical protein